MKNCFGNATVCWDEQEIARRESLVREIPLLLRDAWIGLNGAVKMARTETPILTPADYLQSHIDTGFELIETPRGYLRPETTAGTYVAFDQMFPTVSERRKNLPFCLWQVGLSFRDEANPDTMRASKLRLRQFYQMEFQLFCSTGSKAPYLVTALQALTRRYGGDMVVPTDRPHYSEATLDWHISGLEVAGLSQRSDWSDGEVYEVAIGLDRLVALQMK